MGVPSVWLSIHDIESEPANAFDPPVRSDPVDVSVACPRSGPDHSRQEGKAMGFLDKIKGLAGKNADQIEDGLDKAADMAKDKLPDEHDDKVDSAVEKAKDLVESLEGDAEDESSDG
jgi:hypothetical protein